MVPTEDAPITENIELFLLDDIKLSFKVKKILRLIIIDKLAIA